MFFGEPKKDLQWHCGVTIQQPPLEFFSIFMLFYSEIYGILEVKWVVTRECHFMLTFNDLSCLEIHEI